MKLPAHPVRCVAFLALAAAVLTACSADRYRQRADKEAYAAIAARTPEVPGMLEGFDIAPHELPLLEELDMLEQGEAAVEAGGETEAGSHILGLEQALAIAFKNNRQYQTQKESLYLTALQYTLERHRFAPIFTGKGSVEYHRSTRDVMKLHGLNLAAQQAPELVEAVGTLAGTPGQLLSRYADIVESSMALTGASEPSLEIADRRDVNANTQIKMGLLLQRGGQLTLDLTSNFLRYVSGASGASASSTLTGTLAQPLLRGAGKQVTLERLTQAERDLLYALRDFTRYRKTFVVQVASQYYRVLQNRDAVRNNWQAYQGFQRNVARERAFFKEGRKTLAALGRLEQAELNTENSWISSVRRYKQDLDEFKILLGLPVDAPVVLDDGELDRLRERGLIHPHVTADDAAQVALVARLDLQTVRDEVDDAGRKVLVAANALKPGLGLVLQAQVPSMPGDRFHELDFRRASWSAGLDLDLPLDRKAERNAYRTALIAFERARRAMDLAEDNAKLEVRQAWRDLDQARRSYEIGLRGVELNQRRVQEQELLAELGRATAQNQVDAQNDLTRAQNELTAALVSHTTTRLGFWRDMGILFVKENGQWEEITDE